MVCACGGERFLTTIVVNLSTSPPPPFHGRLPRPQIHDRRETIAKKRRPSSSIHARCWGFPSANTEKAAPHQPQLYFPLFIWEIFTFMTSIYYTIGPPTALFRLGLFYSFSYVCGYIYNPGVFNPPERARASLLRIFWYCCIRRETKSKMDLPPSYSFGPW